MDTTKSEQTTLSDEELIEACEQWVYKLCESRAEAWTLCIPPDFNKDPDILFLELIERFKKAKANALHEVS